MYQKIIDHLKIIITKAGHAALQLKERGLFVEYKPDRSPVSNADKEISDMIYHAVKSLNLDYPIICEEQPLEAISNHTNFWLIDPIDGTRGYIKGNENYTINIALIKDNKPKLGFVYLPAKSKLYYTNHDGKFCIDQNCQPVKINNIINYDEEPVALVSSHHFNEDTKNYLEKHNLKKVIPMTSSVKLCLIAEGVGDIYPKFGCTYEWDTAAGHALVNASGGKIIAENGCELVYGKDGFLNSNFEAMSKKWINNLSLA